MDKNKYCIIMAGGIGSRFWPISRNAKPKQFLDILDTGKSFIRATYERFEAIVPRENFLVVTNREYKDLVLEHIPELAEDQVLCEPIGRNTAPCIAYAAMRQRAMNPNADMIITPSDHFILNTSEFQSVINDAVDFIRENKSLMTIGIKPSRPDTGYGYIQIGKGDEKYSCINRVKTFTEKPTLDVAKVFLESGEFMWNSGIFIWNVETILEAFETHLPELYSLFSSISEHYNTPSESEYIDKIYPECKAVSIDFGVMEKVSNVYVRTSDFGWSDIGTWGSLYQYAPKDESGNVVSENTLLYNTTNSIVKSSKDKLTVIEGLDDYIVVDTDDVLMVCPKSNEQNIKKFIDDVKFNNKQQFV